MTKTIATQKAAKMAAKHPGKKAWVYRDYDYETGVTSYECIMDDMLDNWGISDSDLVLCADAVDGKVYQECFA